MRNVMTFYILSECTNLQDYVDVMVTLIAHPEIQKIEEKCKYVKIKSKNYGSLFYFSPLEY